jgi:hypothetical protein
MKSRVRRQIPIEHRLWATVRSIRRDGHLALLRMTVLFALLHSRIVPG